MYFSSRAEREKKNHLRELFTNSSSKLPCTNRHCPLARDMHRSFASCRAPLQGAPSRRPAGQLQVFIHEGKHQQAPGPRAASAVANAITNAPLTSCSSPTRYSDPWNPMDNCSRLLDLTAVGTRIIHSLPGTAGLEKSCSYGPAACSGFHFFTGEQEDSAQVTSGLIDAGNTKVLQDGCIVFYYRPSTR